MDTADPYLTHLWVAAAAEEGPHLADRGAARCPLPGSCWRVDPHLDGYLSPAWSCTSGLLWTKMSHAWLHGILMDLDQVGVCLVPLP